MSSADEEHFCTYRLLFLYDLYYSDGEGELVVAEVDVADEEVDVADHIDESEIGFVTAAGSIWFADDNGGYLIVEGTGLAAEEYEGGIMVQQYVSTAEGTFQGILELQ